MFASEQSGGYFQRIVFLLPAGRVRAIQTTCFSEADGDMSSFIFPAVAGTSSLKEVHHEIFNSFACPGWLAGADGL
jgi:putative hemolysin